MPLKLIPPREGKTPNFYVRGTYLGNEVFQSTGTGERRVAKLYLERLQAQIERGEFGTPAGPTFEDGVTAYVQAGGEARFLEPLLHHFKERPLSKIDQKAIDEAAQTLYPNASNATRNRQVYTPIRAILKRAGVSIELKRPKGALGETRTEWLWPEQAFRLFKEADKIDPEFGLFLRFLTYTGLRLSEALQLRWNDVRLDEGFAYIAQTKSGDPRPVYLPKVAQVRLGHLRSTRGRVFRFTKSGRLYGLLEAAKGGSWGRGFLRHLPHLEAHLGHLDAPLRRSRHQGASGYRGLARPAGGLPVRARHPIGRSHEGGAAAS